MVKLYLNKFYRRHNKIIAYNDFKDKKRKLKKLLTNFKNKIIILKKNDNFSNIVNKFNTEKKFSEPNIIVKVHSFSILKIIIKKVDKSTQTEEQIINNSLTKKFENIDNIEALYFNKIIQNYKPKGLENFTSNCYLNSLLQCLYYIKDFRNFFLEQNFEKNQMMCLALKDVMKGLNVCDDKTFFSPRKIKNEIKKNIIFKDGQGSDASDLLDFIFEKIICELSDESSSEHTIEYESQIHNKSLMFNEMFKEINFDIIINQLFVGFYEKEFECKNRHLKYSFQNEYRIIFSLEEIFNYYKGKKNITLYDCFEHNRRKQKSLNENSSFISQTDEEDEDEKYEINENSEEKYDGDEKYEMNENSEKKSDEDKNFNKCQLCNQNYLLTEKIFRTPKFLIIILDRGYKKKFDIEVKFDKSIDLTDYIDDEQYEDQAIYQLIGVCIHHGKSGNYGHYTSICLCDDNKYYHFNDSHCRVLENIEEVKLCSPYILFYRRYDLTDEQNAIRECCSVFKRNVVKILKKINSVEGYSFEKGFEEDSLNYCFTEKKNDIICHTSIDFSGFKHKFEKPKITIEKNFEWKNGEKQEKEIIYWSRDMSIKENQEKFKQFYDSYFNEFETKNDRKCNIF